MTAPTREDMHHFPSSVCAQRCKNFPQTHKRFCLLFLSGIRGSIFYFRLLFCSSPGIPLPIFASKDSAVCSPAVPCVSGGWAFALEIQYAGSSASQLWCTLPDGLGNALVPGAASLCLPLEWQCSGNLSVLQENRSPQIHIWFQLVSVSCPTMISTRIRIPNYQFLDSWYQELDLFSGMWMCFPLATMPWSSQPIQFIWCIVQFRSHGGPCQMFTQLKNDCSWVSLLRILVITHCDRRGKRRVKQCKACILVLALCYQDSCPTVSEGAILSGCLLSGR